MKKFRQYLEDIGVDMDSDTPPTKPGPSDDAIIAAAKVAFRKYRSETKQFFDGLAAKDPEIAHALQGGDDSIDGPVGTGKPDYDKDEVMPPESDGSPAENGEG